MTADQLSSADQNTLKDDRPLPKGWVWTKLGELCTKPQYGYTTKALDVGQGPRFLRITDLSDGIVDWDSVPFCEKPPENPAKYVLTQNDLLVARAGSVGKAYRIKNPPFAIFASYLIRFRTLGASAQYLEYFLQSPYYWKQIQQSTMGITIPNVNASKLSNLSLSLAPLAEQNRIVSEIEKQFSRLDAAVAALERAQKNLERYKSSVLKAACEGRLVPQDPDDEPAEMLLERILAERRQKWEEQEWEKQIVRAKKKAAQAKRKQAGRPARIKDLSQREWEDLPEEVYRKYMPNGDKWKEKYQEPEPPDTSELPELPVGWVWVSLAQVNDRITDGTHQPPEFIESGVPFIFVQHIVGGSIVFENTKFISKETYFRLNSRCPVEKGDILYSAVGSYGVAVPVLRDVEFSFQRHIAHMKPVLTDLTDFMVICLNSDFVLRQAHQVARGVAQKTVTLGDLHKFVVPLAPLGEQLRIVTEANRRLTYTQVMKEAVIADLKRSERLRQAILQKAFQGKLVNQDPDDEPANKLLDRIRATREKKSRNAKGVKVQKSGKDKMQIDKDRRALFEVLITKGERMTPDSLFLNAGFNEELVDEFYVELREEIRKGRIVELRPNDRDVYLEAKLNAN